MKVYGPAVAVIILIAIAVLFVLYKENCSCPLIAPMAPNWCTDGRIVDGGKNACGCQMPPTCEPVICTADAKLCPDGSAVGRVGPNCEFAPCHEPNDNLCVSTGGKVTEAQCCLSSGDFPNTCLIGACGCAPAYSHTVRTCDCYNGRQTLVAMCYDAKVGCKTFTGG